MRYLVLFFGIINISFAASYTIQPDPTCVIKGKIEYFMGTVKEIERPINCAFNEKNELSFCEGDEIKSPDFKKNIRLLTLVPKDEMAYAFVPNYADGNKALGFDKVEGAIKYDCAARIGALKKQIKNVVLNNARNQEKPKDGNL